MSKAEYEKYLENMKVSILSTNMADSCFIPNRRDIDIQNELKDMAVTAVQLTAFAIIISNPGTALAGAAAMGSGAAGVADGASRVSQGEGFAGVSEIALSLIDIGGGYKVLKILQKAR